MNNNTRVIERTCNGCGITTTGKIMKCSGCGNVRYCSVDCQKNDWPEHKTECKQMKARQEKRRHLLIVSEAIGRPVGNNKPVNHQMLLNDNNVPYELIIVERDDEVVERWKTTSSFDKIPDSGYNIDPWTLSLSWKNEQLAQWRYFDFQEYRKAINKMLARIPSTQRLTDERLAILEKMVPFVDVVIIFFKQNGLFVMKSMVREESAIKPPKKVQSAICGFSYCTMD